MHQMRSPLMVKPLHIKPVKLPIHIERPVLSAKLQYAMTIQTPRWQWSISPVVSSTSSLNQLCIFTTRNVSLIWRMGFLSIKIFQVLLEVQILWLMRKLEKRLRLVQLNVKKYRNKVWCKLLCITKRNFRNKNVHHQNSLLHNLLFTKIKHHIIIIHYNNNIYIIL